MYVISAFVEFIRQFINVVGVDKKKSIPVGHLLGGYIAYVFVLKYSLRASTNLNRYIGDTPESNLVA